MVVIACNDVRVNNRETFRPRSSYVWFVFAVVLDLLFVAERFTRNNGQAVVAGFFLGAAFAAGAYLLFLRPKVDLYDEAIVITNLITDETIGWQDVVDIETRYSMSVTTADRKVFAVAAPGPSRYHSRTVHETEMRGISVRDSSSIRPGDSPRTHSGVAAHLARLRWEAFNREGRDASVTTQRKRQPLLASIALTSWVVGVLLEVIHL